MRQKFLRLPVSVGADIAVSDRVSELLRCRFRPATEWTEVAEGFATIVVGVPEWDVVVCANLTVAHDSAPHVLRGVDPHLDVMALTGRDQLAHKFAIRVLVVGPLTAGRGVRFNIKPHCIEHTLDVVVVVGNLGLGRHLPMAGEVVHVTCFDPSLLSSAQGTRGVCVHAAKGMVAANHDEFPPLVAAALECAFTVVLADIATDRGESTDGKQTNEQCLE